MEEGRKVAYVQSIVYELERQIVGPVLRVFRVGRSGCKSAEVFAVALRHDPAY